MTARDFFEQAEWMLPQARNYTDNAITCINHKDQQEALRMLAAATQTQNVALGNLCAAVRKLHQVVDSHIPLSPCSPSSAMHRTNEFMRQSQ
jgi:hypothetical protein